jgi:hypothetical protein
MNTVSTHMHALQVESLKSFSAKCGFGVTSNDQPSSTILVGFGGIALAPAIRQSSVGLLELLGTGNQLASDDGVDITALVESPKTGFPPSRRQVVGTDTRAGDRGISWLDIFLANEQHLHCQGAASSWRNSQDPSQHRLQKSSLLLVYYMVINLQKCEALLEGSAM